jgi:hypothetical protein
MVNQLVGRQDQMQKRHAAASLHQTTMTQQFALPPSAEIYSLPQGWQQMWDHPGRKEYFFNTVNHEITFDKA